jgi:hypothetical protein
MKSNLYKYILVVLVAIAPLYSCQDYLTVNPVTEFGPDYVFGNVENATRAVLGVYSTLGGDAVYGIRVSMYYPYDNDEMMGQGPATVDNERRDLAHYNVQPSNTQLSGPFNQLFSGVERANICIYYIPKMAGYDGDAELKRLHGEALTLRAVLYQELIRNWGDVPAQFEPSSFVSDLFLPKTDRDEIYTQILSDLETAEALVPWRTEVTGSNERITQGYVHGLRARIALAAGGYSLRSDGTMQRPANYLEFYQIAKDEAKAVMDKGDHKLNPSFQAIFKDAIGAHTEEPNGEILFEVGMSGGNSANGDSKLGYYNGPQWNVDVSGVGNAALSILPTTFYSYDPADKRRDVTCAVYNLNQDLTVVGRTLAQIADGKFRRDWTANPSMVLSGPAVQYFGLNWPMMRYSDVLLMFAEADNELNGPTPEAYEAINQVRRRGFNKPITTPDATVDLAGLSQADFFTALRKERMLELCGEGIRKYDLIRWNMLSQRLSEVKVEMTNLINGVAPYNNVPRVMYFQPGQTSINWLTSFYAPAPGSPPAGSTQVTWRFSTPAVVAGEVSPIQTTLIDVLAYAFTPNKSELLPFHTSTIDANPKLIQNKGY